MDNSPGFQTGPHGLDGGDDNFADAVAGIGNRPQPASAGGGLVSNAKNHLFEIAEGGRTDLVRNVENVAGLVRELASQVEAIGFEPLSQYARRATALVDDLHVSVRDRNVEELLDEGRRLVRSNPEIALVAAAIVGFIGARMLKTRE